MARKSKAKLSGKIPGRIVLDSGALTKLARDDEYSLGVWKQFSLHDWVSIVPAVILLEALTGDSARDAPENRLIKKLDNTVPCDEVQARVGARMRQRQSKGGRGDVPSGVDAAVAALAEISAPSVILTTDPDDLSALTDDSPMVRVVKV